MNTNNWNEVHVANAPLMMQRKLQVLSQWPHVTVNEHYLTLDGRSENYRKLKSIYLNPMTQPEKFIFGLAFLFSYLSNIPLPDYSNCLWWWHPTPVLLPGKSHGQRSLVGCSPWDREESDFPFTFHFHALEKEMATHSSVLAWRIPGMGEPGGLPSMGSHRVRHDWSDLAAAGDYLDSRELELTRSTSP